MEFKKLLYGRNARVSSVLCYCLQALSCVLGEESQGSVIALRGIAKLCWMLVMCSDANANHCPLLGVVMEHSAGGSGKLKSCFNDLFFVIFQCDGRECCGLAAVRVEGFLHRCCCRENDRCHAADESVEHQARQIASWGVVEQDMHCLYLSVWGQLLMSWQHLDSIGSRLWFTL